MTKRADEPRTTMRVPVSFRELIRGKAKEKNTTMMEILIETFEAGTPSANQNVPATAHVGGHNEG